MYGLAGNVSALGGLLRGQPNIRISSGDEGVVEPVLVLPVHIHIWWVQGVCPLKVVVVAHLGPRRAGYGGVDGGEEDDGEEGPMRIH